MNRFERFMAFMTHPMIGPPYLGVLVLLFLFVDKPLAWNMYYLGVTYSAPWLNTFTELGANSVYIVFFFLLAMYYHFIARNKLAEQRLWFLWCCIVFSSLVAFVLKILFGRARPELLFSDHLYGFYWLKTQQAYFSFPSGHTTTVMSLVFGLGFLFPTYGGVLILAGLLVAGSRIFLTHHYLTDVLAAAYFSLLEVTLLKYLLWPRLGIKKV